MIFVTVGTQLGFDRLIRMMDQWAISNPGAPVFAQIGAGDYKPVSFKWARFLSPSELEDHIKASTLVVSHAGMGTILAALMYQKPIVVVPRMADLGEHRSDHQMATARQLSGMAGVYVAEEQAALEVLLSDLDLAAAAQPIPALADNELVRRLRGVVDSAPSKRRRA